MDLITSYWPQISAFVAVIVWFVRLESSSKNNASAIDYLHRLRENDLKDAKDARTATNQKLDRIEDKMTRGFDEFRADIKELLKRGSSR